MKVLHVSPHVGGGVGTVLSNMLSYFSEKREYEHQLVCLDELGTESKYFLNEHNISYTENIAADQEKLKNLIGQADIVLLHWWNHPLAGYFLYKLQLMGPIRLLIWCHISGLNEPNTIPKEVIEISDKFVFTSPLSFGSKNLKQLNQAQREKLTWIWSTRGVEYMSKFSEKENKTNSIRMLYIGNLDYAKLSPSIFKIAEKLCGKNVKLDIVGPKNKLFIEDLSRCNAQADIRYHGFISEHEKYRLLDAADIFLYPLNTHHYGTCDQTLQEAMAYGVVPVTYDNPMEKYMIEDSVTGMIADTETNFIQKVNTLIHDKELRREMSINCINFAHQTFTLPSLQESWNFVYNSTINIQKTEKKFLNISEKDLGYELFRMTVPSISTQLSLLIESRLNDIRPATEDNVKQYFSSNQQRSYSKSSIKQFLQYFPYDNRLNQLSRIFTNTTQCS
jgi:glycosyltransferase involved in cell wall biosynthesis